MIKFKSLTNIFSRLNPPSQKMGYRRLGKTNLWLSAVGFGTCQLRRVPEKQALATLHKGFEQGVNFVHCAPDYEGAEDIVAKAISETNKNIHVCTQAYDTHGNSDGFVDNFERLFEEACVRFDRPKIDLFGIACIDDREAFAENVWGKKGMIEFLLEKKAQGRIEAIFCTTHGSPEYIKNLLERDVFDALMIAYNPLGFHLLSYNPTADRHFEDLSAVPSEIFPLAQEKEVGLMIMKPLAGGLLCNSKAFPPRTDIIERDSSIQAQDILRLILNHEAVTSVVPGTASVEEAQENAIAGHNLNLANQEDDLKINQYIQYLQSTLCSRCGICDDLCSQELPISWLFRASYVNLFPSETFETWDDVEYFKIHPHSESSCGNCQNITCKCPYGIDIPTNMIKLHGQMQQLRNQGHVGDPENKVVQFDDTFSAKPILHDIPEVLSKNQTQTCRIYVENTSNRGWFPDATKFANASVKLMVFIGDICETEVFLKTEVNCHERTHFVFSLTPPFLSKIFPLRLVLVAEHLNFSLESGLILYNQDIKVQ